jgi:hypothetical protein
MSVSIVHVPNVLLRQVGLLLVAKDLLRLCRICRCVWAQRAMIMISLARMEQERMRMPLSPFRIRLSLADVVERWRQLTPRVARSVRDALDRQPLVFYSGRFDPATVLLEEGILAMQRHSDSLSIRAMQEEDIKKAVILARSIPNASIRSLTLRDLALRHGVRFLTALGIARSIPIKALRSAVLRAIALRDDVPYETAFKIACSIPIESVRSATLKDIALEEGVPLEIALKFARSISIAADRSAALRAIALREDVPLEIASEIARSISIGTVKSATLRVLALRNGVPLKTALKIARSIPTEAVKRAALRVLARRHGTSPISH